MKQFVNPFDYADHICNALKKGVLITTASGENVNTMTMVSSVLGGTQQLCQKPSSQVPGFTDLSGLDRY